MTKRFRKNDAPWIEETVWIYQGAGFLKAFKDDATLVPSVVHAFEAKYARPPVWNTPFENQRILALDEKRTSFRWLLDFDRQPALKGLYAAVLGDWARISFGAFPTKKIREVWHASRRKVDVTFELGGQLRKVSPRVYQHGQFDLSIINAVNKLLPKGGRNLLATQHDGGETRTLVVALDGKNRMAFERDRGFRFFGVSDFKKMKALFDDRDKEWAEDEEEDDDE